MGRSLKAVTCSALLLVLPFTFTWVASSSCVVNADLMPMVHSSHLSRIFVWISNINIYDYLRTGDGHNALNVNVNLY